MRKTTIRGVLSFDVPFSLYYLILDKLSERIGPGSITIFLHSTHCLTTTWRLLHGRETFLTNVANLIESKNTCIQEYLICMLQDFVKKFSFSLFLYKMLNSQLKDKLREVARKGIALCFVQMDGQDLRVCGVRPLNHETWHEIVDVWLCAF